MTAPAIAPVIVGVGSVVQHTDAEHPGREAVALMIDAAHQAIDQAGLPARHIGLVAVPRGTWRYGDAARLVADAVGADGATTLTAEIGVLQTTVLSAAFEAVAEGRVDAALVVGGEALDRRRTAHRAGRRAEETITTGPEADIVLRPAVDFRGADESAWGLEEAFVQYALIDSARRHRLGIDVRTNRRQLAETWSGLSAVATTNPQAWEPQWWSADDLLDEQRSGNRVLAWPYTSKLVTQMYVDQAAAVLVCSDDLAVRFGVAPTSLIHPTLTVDSELAVPLVERRHPGSCPQWDLIGAEVESHLDAPVASVDHVDLYSCFPVAVSLQRDAFGLQDRADLTVTGGMTFGGGPLNNAALQAVARAGALLRGRADRTAVVTAVSGLLTKQGALVLRTGPPVHPYRRIDVTGVAEGLVARRPTLATYRGPATVEATTVVVPREGPPEAVAIVRTTDGSGTVARSTAPGLVESFRVNDWIGEAVDVADGLLVAAGALHEEVRP